MLKMSECQRGVEFIWQVVHYDHNYNVCLILWSVY